jgi:hypothetical protein
VELHQLKRLRIAVLVVVLAGVLSSVLMNVLHAPDNLAARFVGALPPLAVFGCLELIVRIPSSSRALSWFRIGGAVLVAGGAAYLSYFQQKAAISDLGFPHDQAAIWPGVIDGTMVVASLSLLEVVRKIRQLTDSDRPAANPVATARVWTDQFEAPETLAFREAQKKMREEEAQRAKERLNGSKVAA